jgi:hypothetical protein
MDELMIIKWSTEKRWGELVATPFKKNETK